MPNKYREEHIVVQTKFYHVRNKSAVLASPSQDFL